MKKVSRGLRNNNPGNIRHNGDHFQGEANGRDKSFKTFTSMAHGYRAIFKILNTYQSKYSLKSIKQMIERWAPRNENDTDAYIAFVSDFVGIDPDHAVDINDMSTISNIVAAISQQENGSPAVMTDVQAGYNLL